MKFVFGAQSSNTKYPLDALKRMALEGEKGGVRPQYACAVSVLEVALVAHTVRMHLISACIKSAQAGVQLSQNNWQQLQVV